MNQLSGLSNINQANQYFSRVTVPVETEHDKLIKRIRSAAGALGIDVTKSISLEELLAVLLEREVDRSK